MRLLRLSCPNPKVDIRVQMGDGPATPTAGVAGWEATSRTGGERAITTRTSPPPHQQDVPIFLNGLRDGRSVQRQLDAIISLGEVDAEPFRAYGPIHFDGALFVFGGELEYGETIRDDDNDDVLIRQRLTLKLMKLNRPNAVKERQRRRQARGRRGIDGNVAVGGTHRVTAGETLQSIAAHELNDWRRWQEIGNKNGLTDPNRPLPAGKVLKL